MSQKTTQAYIHYDPERVDYSMTGQELDQLKNASSNHWKDFCIISFSLGVPCLINAIVEISKQDQFVTTLSFNLNLVVGIIGLFLGIAFAIAWRRSHTSIVKLIEVIKNKPKMPVPPSFVNIGAIEK